MRAFSLLAAALAGQALAVPLEAESFEKRNWPAIDTFLAEIASLFPASFLINSGCDLISFGENAAADIFGIPDTRNDPCGDVTMIFARGTCDAGNIGVLVAPFVARSIQENLGRRTLAVKGLTYPASVVDYLTGSKPNGVLLANMINTTIAQCPNTKIVVGGYSQGAMVVHNAAAALDAATMAHVSAVVLFGDPYSHQPVANIDSSRVKVYCNPGDNICDNGPIITVAHLTYATYADAAAAFVVSHV
ncbi:Cutinase [Escovopsis weberi]|uniref:Cutinase n=1 Tax=Escovopsis weberi TaxID=150374 RepID=A0A0M8N0H0_ESCWE|nr:Cutinase [Escovopsis weberi]